MATTKTKSSSDVKLRWILGILIIAALLVSAFLAGRASVDTAPAALPATSVGPLGEQSRREAGDPLALGPVDAPVVIINFSDYRCPFCARHSRVTEQELIERYVESGQLRIEWRDLPIFGDASLLAARAGRAAAEQDLFWEYNQTIFAAAPEGGHHELTEPLLLEFAGQVGMPDLEQFETDMLSERFDESIEADFMQAVSLGMTGTPSFVVNGHPVVGAQPTAVFMTMIDEALAGQ